MEIYPPKKIKIADVYGKGRGVVAIEDIKKDEIIEICPIVFISEKEKSFFEKENTTLKYYYLQQYAIDKYCLMLGYGSVYNHSFIPNADVDYNTRNIEDYLTFHAVKEIKAGEEILIDYEFDNHKEDFLKLD